MLDAVVGDGSPSPMLFAEVRHGGGAVQRTNPDVRFAARDGERLLELVGLVTGPGVAADIDERMERTWRRLDPLLAPLPGFLNFVEGHERVELSARAFDPSTRSRLAAAKRAYDPQD